MLFSKFISNKKIILCLSTVSGILLGSAASLPVYAVDPSFNKLPDFAKRDAQRSRAVARRCPKPFRPNPIWRFQISTGTSTPAGSGGTDAGGLVSERKWGIDGINKLFVHTMNTRQIKPNPCCRVQPGTFPRVYLDGKTTPQPSGLNPNINGNITNNEYLQFMENGSFYNPQNGTQNMGTYPLPAFNWVAASGPWVYTVPPTVSITDGDLTVALGDDTNIRRVALVAQFCCLEEEKAPRNLRANPNARKQFLDRMKRDKGSGRAQPDARRMAPALRSVQ